ncbi:MAG: hypothetical protein JW731_08035, partial [Bacteroidales bacterium]|nr:hypothetical protein [Bacteroidales bacterium]
MQRFISIFFVTVFLFNLAGYYPVFLIKQIQLRNEMQEIIPTLPENQLVIIKLQTDQLDDLRWIKSNEFIYKEVL